MERRAEPPPPFRDIARVLHGGGDGARRGEAALFPESPRPPRWWIDRLLALSEPQRRLLLANAPPIGWAEVTEALLAEIAVLRTRDGIAVKRLAELAVQVASLVPGSRGEVLLGRAWTELGNARRILSDFVGAEMALSEAGRLLSRNRADEAAAGFLLAHQASLAWAKDDSALAAKLAAWALRRFKRCGDPLGVVCSLLQLGLYRGSGPNPSTGLTATLSALRIADHLDFPEFRCIAIVNLAVLLRKSGQIDVAAQIETTARPLIVANFSPASVARFEWSRAETDRDLGNLKEAGVRLEQVRAQFTHMGYLNQWAHVSLTLAEVYRRLGRRSQVIPLASEAAEIFDHLGIQKNFAAARRLLA